MTREDRMTSAHDVPHIRGHEVIARMVAGPSYDSVDPVVWPGFVVPPPPMVRVDIVEDDAGWFTYADDLAARSAWIAPDRLYLDALKVDPFDPAAVMDFARGRGRFVVPFVGRRFSDVASTLTSYVEKVTVHTKQRAGDAGNVHAVFSDMGDDLVEVHVDEVGVRLLYLQKMVRHVIRFRDGDYVGPAWGPNVAEDFAWLLFKSVSDNALGPFHVGVQLTYRIRDEAGHPQQASLLLDRASLYSIMVLQLVNDLAALVDYHTCASCGARFVHQTGRGTGAQHRLTGVKYCSKRCADREQRKRYRQVHRNCTDMEHVCGRTPRPPRPRKAQQHDA